MATATMTGTGFCGRAVERTRNVSAFVWLVTCCAGDARRLIAHERMYLPITERDNIEIVADATRDAIADVLHGECLSDTEYDYARDVILDMLRCNGNAVESAAAAYLMNVGV